MTETDSGASIGRRLGDLVLDAAGIAGAGLITYGASLIYRPAAFIIAGAFLLAAVWLLAGRAD